MRSNSYNRIYTIEQFREWLHQPGGIEIENTEIQSLFDVNIHRIPPDALTALTPNDEKVMFNQMPPGSTEEKWVEKLSEWINIFMENHIILK